MDTHASNSPWRSQPNTNNLGLGTGVHAKLFERKLVSSNLFLAFQPSKREKDREFEFVDLLWSKGRDKKGSNYPQRNQLSLSTQGAGLTGGCLSHLMKSPSVVR